MHEISCNRTQSLEERSPTILTIRPTGTSGMNAYGQGTFSYIYDAVNRQTNVITPQLGMTTLAYDPLGRVVTRQTANGTVTTQTYDLAGNLSGITNFGSNGNLVNAISYQYNAANVRTMQSESDGTVTTWTYDREYRLLNENRQGGPENTSFNVTHTYDPVGNRLTTNDGL